MVLRYCLGMIMSVSTLIIWSGAATPSSLVNLSIKLSTYFGKNEICPSHDGSGRAGQARGAHAGPSEWPAALVTCLKDKDRRGNSDVDGGSGGQQDFGHQVAPGHRGGGQRRRSQPPARSRDRPPDQGCLAQTYGARVPRSEHLGGRSAPV